MKKLIEKVLQWVFPKPKAHPNSSRVICFLALDEIPDKWPKQGPDFNEWNLELSKFADLLERAGAFWCVDTKLKYLSIWTDTRDGAFLIFDEDKNKIEIERVLKAMKKWKTLY